MDRSAVAALSALLDRQIAAGDALVSALESERVALTGFDLAALEETTRAKQALAAEFELLDGERRRTLARYGYGPGRTDMAALIRAVEDPGYREDARRLGPLGNRWRRLVTLIERCRDDNQRNGMIVSLQTQRVTKTLNVLRTGRPDELTYGRARAPGLAQSSRALGRV
jgi:flagellar biosynthesis/type III secretory pathway chaperone